MEGHVVVCGMGHVGLSTILALRQFGVRVVAVDRQPDPSFREEVERAGATVLQRDMRERQALEAAGLPSARALVLATGDDQVNIEVLFQALAWRPDLRVVFRLTDGRMARRLGETLPTAIGVAVPELAAPAFAFALASPAITRALVVADQHWAVADVDLARQPLRLDPAAPVTVLAATTPAGEEALPARLPAGATRATIAGPWEAVRVALQAAQPWPRWQPGPVRRFVAALQSVRRALWVMLALLLVAIAVNSAFFTAVLHISLVDAIYFVTTTLTTIGYGDIALRAAPAPVKLYAAALMVFGTLMTALFYALVTEHIIGHRFERLLAARPLPTRGHVVVCGLGTVGLRVVTALRDLGAPVAVVDRRPESALATRVRDLGVPIIDGDAASPAVLATARAAAASSVVVATSDDLTNLAIVLTAQQEAAKQHVVLRLFDHALAARIRDSLGIDATLSPAALAATAFAAHAAYGPAALDCIDLAGQPHVVWAEEVAHPATVAQAVGDGGRALLLRRHGGDVLLPVEMEVLPGDLLVSLRPAAVVGPASQPDGAAPSTIATGQAAGGGR